jgi:hypothetical protein
MTAGSWAENVSGAVDLSAWCPADARVPQTKR